MQFYYARLSRLLVFILYIGLVIGSCSATFAASPDGRKEEPEPEWVLPYAVVGLSLTGVLILVIRSSRRGDSAITEYDRKIMREEEVKQAKQKQ